MIEWSRKDNFPADRADLRGKYVFNWDDQDGQDEDNVLVIFGMQIVSSPQRGEILVEKRHRDPTNRPATISFETGTSVPGGTRLSPANRANLNGKCVSNRDIQDRKDKYSF